MFETYKEGKIGRRVREVREDLGMQRTVLARRVGVAENTIYRIETGKRAPSVELLEKIARELRTEPAEFLREPALAGTAEASTPGPDLETSDEYDEVLMPRMRLTPEALQAAITAIKEHEDQLEDLSVSIEGGYIEVGLKVARPENAWPANP